MRIAQIAPPWLPVPPEGYGGVERLVGNLTEGLADRGHDVTLFAPPGSRTRGRLISPLEYTPLLKGPDAADDDMFYMLSAYLSADQFDVIHDHTTSRVGLLGQCWVAVLPSCTRCTCRGRRSGNVFSAGLTTASTSSRAAGRRQD